MTTTPVVRSVPPMGGFNLTFLGLEVRRMLRNRRTLVFALVMPPVFFLLFGTSDGYTDTSAGRGNVTAYAATDVTPLNGTGTGEVDHGIMLALARFDGAPCVLLGQDRRHQDAHQPLGPAALREARRGMRLAVELQLPLVTVIDTPGAALSQAAEEGGLAGEIARCLADLVTLDAPTVSVLLGQGTGGGALALVPTDRVIAARNAWLSPLPPEGASAIVHRDTSHAAEMAAEQGVRSGDLQRSGIVDRIVEEHPDAADEPADFCRRMGRVLADELYQLMPVPPTERLRRRHRRYRDLGLPG